MVTKYTSSAPKTHWQRFKRFSNSSMCPRLTDCHDSAGGLLVISDTGRCSTSKRTLGLSDKKDPTMAPDILLMVSDEVVVFDNLGGRLHVVVHTDPEEEDAWETGNARLDELVAMLDQSASEPATCRAPDRCVKAISILRFRNRISRLRSSGRRITSPAAIFSRSFCHSGCRFRLRPIHSHCTELFER